MKEYSLESGNSCPSPFGTSVRLIRGDHDSEVLATFKYIEDARTFIKTRKMEEGENTTNDYITT